MQRQVRLFWSSLTMCKTMLVLFGGLHLTSQHSYANLYALKACML